MTDTEKVRDAAIALITSSLYAAQIEDKEQWATVLREDFSMLAKSFDLTDNEFIGLPSVLCQINAIVIILLANSYEQEPEELWQAIADTIRKMGPPKDLSGGETAENE